MGIQPAPSHVEEAGYAIAEADRYPTEAKRALAAAQAHAALALVEVTERLAVAQETANLIAYTNGLQSAMDRRLGGQGGPVARLVQKMAEDIRDRIGYPNS